MALQHSAINCNTLQHNHEGRSQHHVINCNTMQHTATPCNTLQHTATHCNTLQRTATHCNTLQHTATHCNTLQHTATHCNTLQHTATHRNTPQHTTTHCNTLYHTATHCNTLQHTHIDHLHCFRTVVPVGRLDFDSEGLLLLTNDGSLCKLLTCPQFRIPKTYAVLVQSKGPVQTSSAPSQDALLLLSQQVCVGSQKV